MTFQKKLCLALEKHPTYPGVVKQFISGLESHIKDRNQFKNCLLPCTPVRAEGSSVGTFGTNFPRLIVNQFKWLDRLLDSQVGADGAITSMLFPVNSWNISQVG
ncbi:hypothetical protein llap_21500 [Limosa lapponica baueri]|uniref:Uncharacterized protein n=1 Tax=Limosa lapponica baueri TaxID=1758121 RepID=A0A2I0T314_LIMLA|nr:hypothetical protein llap_21500 [Limosa lapponica baueri]